jgi:hypothetical protein
MSNPSLELSVSEHPTRVELANFFGKVQVVRLTGCWLWRAATSTDGVHGVYGHRGQSHSAYVWSYRWFVGDIPKGLHLDHLCFNGRCVNPAHVEPVTAKENILRWSRTVTHCKRGHEFTPENTRVYGCGYNSKGVHKTARYCVACMKIRDAAAYARKRGLHVS